jgi:DNA-directed RNA polymerase subunit RPC12/RpoP
MVKIPITVMGYRCERCSHEWVPKDPEKEPSVCPKCKSPYWNRPRKNAPATRKDGKDGTEQEAGHAARGSQVKSRRNAK